MGQGILTRQSITVTVRAMLNKTLRAANTQKLDNRTIANPFDGKVNFGGYHPKLSPAKPASIANYMVNNRPAFSALARNVKHHPNGVTSTTSRRLVLPLRTSSRGSRTSR